MSNEQTLWRSVIHVAITDLKHPRLRPAAMQWFFGPDDEPDFVKVCHFAGVDPGQVRKRVKELTMVQ